MTFLLIDIGATKMRFGWSNGHRIVRRAVVATPTRWLDAYQEIRQRVNGVRPGRVIIGVPGMVDAKNCILSVSNLPEWPATIVTRDLKKLFGKNLHIENDAVLNALGEATDGAGVGHDIVGFLTMSTGVNGMRIINGQPDRHAFPIELGYLLVHDGKSMTTLGRAVSGQALQDRYGRPAAQLRTPRIWRDVERILAQAIVNLSLTWAPDVFIVGGSITKSLSVVAIQREVKRLWHHHVPVPKIRFGRLGDLSGIYGALTLAKQKPQP